MGVDTNENKETGKMPPNYLISEQTGNICFLQPSERPMLVRQQGNYSSGFNKLIPPDLGVLPNTSGIYLDRGGVDQGWNFNV